MTVTEILSRMEADAGTLNITKSDALALIACARALYEWNIDYFNKDAEAALAQLEACK